MPFKDAVRRKVKIQQNSRNNSSTELTESTSVTKMNSLSDEETVDNERKSKDITPYLNLMLMLSASIILTDFISILVRHFVVYTTFELFRLASAMSNNFIIYSDFYALLYKEINFFKKISK